MDIVNWEAIGAIGEIVGAVAVVSTLLFLVIQLRQNTSAVEESRKANVSQLYQFRANMHMDGTLRVAESTGYNVIELQLKVKDEGICALTEAEKHFMRLHQTAAAVRLDNGLFQHHNGFLDDDYLEYVETVIATLYPLWVDLDVFQVGFRPGFIEEAERIWRKKRPI
jgi:hypothetical protein